MKTIWLAKKGRGWLPADEDAERIHRRMEEGEAAAFRPMRVRDPVAHRRYWGLMTLCANNCERIDLPQGGVLLVHNKDDVHTAMKLCTGHYTVIFDPQQRPIGYVPKSTNFEDMTADEWEAYWPRVLDVISEYILPGVEIPEVELEILKCMGQAA